MITNHVTNLEISKRLKELRVEQESLFWWVDIKEWCVLYFKEMWLHCRMENRNLPERYPAYLASEIFDKLPCMIDTEYGDCWLHIEKGIFEKGQLISETAMRSVYQNWKRPVTDDNYRTDIIHEDNLVNTLGKMLIYLIEQGHVKP